MQAGATQAGAGGPAIAPGQVPGAMQQALDKYEQLLRQRQRVETGESYVRIS
jgi:hypothetical protein